MKPTNSAEIRQAFLDFFQEMGHQVVPSSPLPILDNPTLLFTNAGMNQFVDTFLGKEERNYKRAASAQKCMRVQGKHNDLENVGPSPRHHTFFEMLGNFSFGDYFKAGAIRYGYDFLTEVCQIPAEKLWFTVHIDDDEAHRIWVEEIKVAPERVLRMGDSTNFWMMGDVGPCGPTSEIHYDWGPEQCTCDEPNCSVLLDNECGRWLELWNLVFMQFDQDENGIRTPLPKPGVDTGLGLERITSVVELEPVNYKTDLFSPAMQRVQEILGDSEEERLVHETGYRVIADHGRAATFLIADGVLPGNVGRGYVLRMIIRRAARYGRMIGFTEPFLAEIASVYIEQMGDIYPELVVHREHVTQTVTAEEERFARTLGGALEQLDAALADLHRSGQTVLPGDLAFDLYATHGLPVEITRDVAGERGFSVDEEGFQAARKAHAETSGAGAFGQYETKDSTFGELFARLVADGQLDSGGVDYDPYSGPRMESEILALLSSKDAIAVADVEQSVTAITAATPFYVEAGGEVSDTGRILNLETGAEMIVTDIRRPVPGLVVHIGKIIKGRLAVGDIIQLEANEERQWDIRRNHTATHILHQELRDKLGRHVTQQGSLVAPDRLRFDFSHAEAIGESRLRDIEAAINEVILANLAVSAEYMPQKEAIAGGAMALFGEKYGEIVRTIRVGSVSTPYSFELCGGLHVNSTGDIGLFRFTGEEAVGAGLRRVEAVTGRAAQALVRDRLDTLDRLSHKLNTTVSDLEARLDALIVDNGALRSELTKLRRLQARNQFENLLDDMLRIGDSWLMAAIVEAASMEALLEMADWFREKVDSGVAVLAAVKNERPIFVSTVTQDLVQRGVDAGDIVVNVAKVVGGGGGGRPSLAQAGGKDVGQLPTAMARVPDLVREALNA